VGVNVRHSAGEAVERLRMLTPTAAHALGHHGPALTDGQWSSDQAPGCFLLCPPGTSIDGRTVVVRPDSWVLPSVSTRDQHWPTDRRTVVVRPDSWVLPSVSTRDQHWPTDRRTVVVRPGSWVLPCVSTRDQHWPTDSGRQTRLLGASLCVHQGAALADGQWS